MKKTLVPIALVFALIAVAPAALGATSPPANIFVSASIAPNCTIAALPIAFGPYDPVVVNASTALSANGAVTVYCTKGSTGLRVDLGLGNNSANAASGTTRAMKGGTSTDFLSYELYQPSSNTPGAACAYLTPWGTVAAGLGLAPSTTKDGRTYSVCGRIPAAQDASADASYTDTVVATVNF